MLQRFDLLEELHYGWRARIKSPHDDIDFREL
jgi:hypothetical protein